MSIIIPFRVTSDRIHDVELHDGTTVGQFVKYLRAWGYDVKDARIVVRRHRQKDVLIGQLDNYRLNDLDAVEFNTDVVDMPVADRLAAEHCCGGCKACAPKQEAPRKGIRIVINGKVAYEG